MRARRRITCSRPSLLPLLVVVTAGWTGRQQAIVIEYLEPKNCMLHRPVTYCIFFLSELATRVVHTAGIVAQPNEAWMLHIGRNFTDAERGMLDAKSNPIWSVLQTAPRTLIEPNEAYTRRIHDAGSLRRFEWRASWH